VNLNVCATTTTSNDFLLLCMCSRTTKQGAESAGYKIACGSRRMQRSSSAASSPVEISDSVKSMLRVTRSTSEVGRGVAIGAAALTGSLATSIANSTAAVVTDLCPVKGGGGVIGDVGAVMGATVGGVAKVYLAMNEAAGVFCSQTAQATTELINHKYGSEAAEVTADGFAAAGNLTSTARAMQSIGLHPSKVAAMEVGPVGLAGSFARKTARATTISTVQRLSDANVLDDEMEERLEDEESEFKSKLEALGAEPPVGGDGREREQRPEDVVSNVGTRIHSPQ